MKWSIRLGRFLGIDVFVHVTFVLFLVWLGYATYAQTGQAALALKTTAFIVTIFTCVLLHEYGHALTARRYGIPTKDITLLPIGGVARLERMPADPRQELLVAVAGPAVNVVIAAAIAIWLKLDNTLHLLGANRLLSGDFLVDLLKWNLLMVAFNMLPAFPMDGGRVVRALLAMRMPYVKATRAAATVGQGMAFLFGLAGLLTGHFMLLFIALFVWIGASNEAVDAEETSLLTGLRARDAMMTDFRLLSPNDTAIHAARLIRDGWQADFPVVFEGRLVGLVTRQDVVRIYETGNPAAAVETFMRRQPPECLPHEDLSGVLERLRESNLPLMPVVEAGLLRGLVTAENVVETLMFRRALSRRREFASGV